MLPSDDDHACVKMRGVIGIVAALAMARLAMGGVLVDCTSRTERPDSHQEHASPANAAFAVTDGAPACAEHSLTRCDRSGDGVCLTMAACIVTLMESAPSAAFADRTAHQGILFALFETPNGPDHTPEPPPPRV